MMIYGINPVREAIRSGTYRPVRLHVLSSKRGERGQLDWIVREMGGPDAGPVTWSDRRILDKLAGGGNHQGVCAETRDFEPVDDPIPPQTGSRSRLVVLLDGITDPQNLGAICRAAVAFNADAIVLPADRSAHPGPVAARVSSGAMFHARIAVVTNLNRAAQALSEGGFALYGLDGRADAAVSVIPPEGDVALAIGSEGLGLRKSLRARCDALVRLPTDPGFPQLNAATATAVALFAARRGG